MSTWQVTRGRFDAIVSDGENTANGNPYVFVSDRKLGNALLELDWEDVVALRTLLNVVHENEQSRKRRKGT